MQERTGEALTTGANEPQQRRRREERASVAAHFGGNILAGNFLSSFLPRSAVSAVMVGFDRVLYAALYSVRNRDSEGLFHGPIGAGTSEQRVECVLAGRTAAKVALPPSTNAHADRFVPPLARLHALLRSPSSLRLILARTLFV